MAKITIDCHQCDACGRVEQDGNLQRDWWHVQIFQEGLSGGGPLDKEKLFCSVKCIVKGVRSVPHGWMADEGDY